MTIEQKKFPDGFVLKTSEGTVWHEMLEELNVWDEIEGVAKMRVPLEGGGFITIRGRYDAIRVTRCMTSSEQNGCRGDTSQIQSPASVELLHGSIRQAQRRDCLHRL